LLQVFKPFFCSIRGRLALLVIALVAPALLLVSALIVQAYRSERAAVSSKLLSTARAVAGVVDREMRAAESVLITLAATNALLQDDLPTVDAVARRALEGSGRWLAIGDESHRQILNTRVPFGTSLPDIIYEADHAWAMDERRTYISNLVDGRVAREPVLHVSRAIVRGERLRYTLHLVTRPETFAQAMDVTRYAPGSLISVVDRRGRIVARSRDPQRFVGQYASARMARMITEQDEGVQDTTTLDGVQALTAFHRAPVSGWVAVVSTPRAELFSSSRQLLGLGLGLAAVLVLCAGTFAIWIIRGLTRSVGALAADTDAVARGIPASFRPSGLAEIDVVAESVGKTARHLREASDELEAALAHERSATAEAKAAMARLNFSLSSLALGEWEWIAATDEMRISARTAEIYELDASRLYTREEARAALHPDDRERAREAARVAAETGTDYAIEYRVQNPAFGERWVAAAGHPVRDERGKLVAMIGVVQDITDRKTAELVLRTQNEVLEQRVAERTASLREKIGELEAFSYSVSHDMRAPLRSMHGYAELLLNEASEGLSAPHRHFLSRISVNAARLDLLVRDVLAYSRVTQEEIELRVIDLATFLPALVQQMPEHALPDVAIHLDAPLPRVRAHEAYLSQIFTNIIGNAVKFTSTERRPEIRVAVTQRDGLARITVADNGIGIAPEHFERVFQIFGRVHPDQAYPGTGIGLAIVKKAVHRMGGEIGKSRR
jgi:PAS domain S-box-containing protein